MICDGVRRELPSTTMLSTTGGAWGSCCGSWAREPPAPQKEGDGGEEGTETLHQHGVRSGAPAPGRGRRRRRQAWVPVRARKTSRSPSGATSTSISSPRPNSPIRIFSLSGSSTNFWIARLSGRAP